MDKKTYTDIRKNLNFEPSLAILTVHLLQDLALAGAVVFLLAKGGIVGYVVAQPLLACLFFRAFCVMHEAVHGTLSKNQRHNDWLGVIYGGLCFLPFTTWRSMHRDHHAWVGNFERDPVMKMVREFPGKSELHKKADTYLWRSWIPYIAFLQEAVFWTVSAKMITEKESFAGRRKELIASVAAPLFAAVGLILIGRATGSSLSLLPSVVIYLAMVEVINLPHHLRLPRLTGSGGEKLSLWNQYKVSRTCVYVGWFSRFVLLNFNYHAEHHMFPTLPWHQLPVAHENVRTANPEGYQYYDGYAWIRENRQKDLKEVFSPTEILEPEESGTGSKAA